MIKLTIKTPNKTYKLIRMVTLASSDERLSLYADRSRFDKKSIIDSDIGISAQDIVSYDYWYKTFVETKTTHMLTGGTTSHYKFEKGLNSYGKDGKYVKKIADTEPDSEGNIEALSSKYVSVNGLSIHHTKKKHLTELYKLLYSCASKLSSKIQEISERMLIYSPSEKAGTYGAYLALVSRYNYLVWYNSFILKASSSGGPLCIAVGYNNASSNSLGEISIVLDLYCSTADQTVYYNGSSGVELSLVSLDKNGTLINGDGTGETYGEFGYITAMIKIPPMEKFTQAVAMFSIGPVGAPADLEDLSDFRATGNMSSVSIKATWSGSGCRNHTKALQGDQQCYVRDYARVLWNPGDGDKYTSSTISHSSRSYSSSSKSSKSSRVSSSTSCDTTPLNIEVQKVTVVYT